MSVDNPTEAKTVTKLPIRPSPELPLRASPKRTKNLTKRQDIVEYLDSTFTRNQLAFIENYCRGCSARESSIKAGYSAGTDPWGILYQPKIWNEIQRRLSIHFEKNKLTTERILEGVARCAEANVLDYVEIKPDGTWAVNLNNITREMGDAIQELYFDAAGRPRVKLVDKVAAKTLLARLKGMLNETQKIELTGKDGTPLNTIQAFDSIIMNTTINHVSIDSKERHQLPDAISNLDQLTSNNSRPVLDAHVE